MAKKKTCFVIGPIGKPESETRKWADKVFKYIIKPAVEDCGYDTPVRADQIPRPGSITTEVLQHLLNDDLVIADLTGPNANAFYELAVRHARQKPFIHLIRKGEESPFDTKDLRTIPIDTEIDEVEQSLKEIKKYIPEVEKAGDQIHTPISQVVEWELMKASGDDQQKALAEILPRLDGIESYLDRLAHVVDAIDSITKSAFDMQQGYRPLADIFKEQQEKRIPSVKELLENALDEALKKQLSTKAGPRAKKLYP